MFDNAQPAMAFLLSFLSRQHGNSKHDKRHKKRGASTQHCTIYDRIRHGRRTIIPDGTLEWEKAGEEWKGERRGWTRKREMEKQEYGPSHHGRLFLLGLTWVAMLLTTTHKATVQSTAGASLIFTFYFVYYLITVFGRQNTFTFTQTCPLAWYCDIRDGMSNLKQQVLYFKIDIVHTGSNKAKQ